MFRVRVFSLAFGVLGLMVLSLNAQGGADLKAILKKAIEAHGGEKILTKFQAGTSKFKGTIETGMGLADVKGETAFQKPDKMKNSMTIEFMNKVVLLTQVFDGKKFWISAAGNTTEITDEKILKEVRESLQVEASGNMIEFLKDSYELGSIGEVKVKGKDAVGIRVSKKGQRDFSLFFDKKTHLIVKSEMRAFDFAAQQEVTHEKYMVEYQEKQGLQMAKKVEIHKDGKLFMSLEITETQALEKLDDSVFAKP